MILSSVSPWVRRAVMKVVTVAAVKHPSSRRIKFQRWVNWAARPSDRAGQKLAAPAACRSGSSRWCWWSSEGKFDLRRKGGSSDWSELLRKMEVRSWMIDMWVETFSQFGRLSWGEPFPGRSQAFDCICIYMPGGNVDKLISIFRHRPEIIVSKNTKHVRDGTPIKTLSLEFKYFTTSLI